MKMIQMRAAIKTLKEAEKSGDSAAEAAAEQKTKELVKQGSDAELARQLLEFYKNYEEEAQRLDPDE